VHDDGSRARRAARRGTRARDDASNDGARDARRGRGCVRERGGAAPRGAARRGGDHARRGVRRRAGRHRASERRAMRAGDATVRPWIHARARRVRRVHGARGTVPSVGGAPEKIRAKRAGGGRRRDERRGAGDDGGAGAGSRGAGRRDARASSDVRDERVRVGEFFAVRRDGFAADVLRRGVREGSRRLDGCARVNGVVVAGADQTASLRDVEVDKLLAQRKRSSDCARERGRCRRIFDARRNDWRRTWRERSVPDSRRHVTNATSDECSRRNHHTKTARVDRNRKQSQSAPKGGNKTLRRFTAVIPVRRAGR